ncbi:MAG TPA: alpha/beta hydrolase [Candidatus Methylomirabilis sp.]|nr:alpha/beta hydrolase [Candidatus Methylomirabilis sp.]
MNRRFAVILVVACFSYAKCVDAASSSYSYPYDNPYEATVLGLPPSLEVQLPAAVPTREFRLKVFPEREIPEVFWYEDGLVCSLVYQDHPAPLVFVIGGTAAHYDSPTVVKLQKLLYQAGFHAIGITSPGHMDFVVNATTDLPGDSLGDARDLYRVMRLAYEQVRERITVSSFALTGYSLGAFNAAFLAQLDAEEKQFNFTRVLLINPPVNLYTSVSLLDQLLVDNIPGGMDRLDDWFRSVLRHVLAVSRQMGRTELSGEFLYNIYDSLPHDQKNLQALIGLVFRLSAAHMIFTADVMNGGGYIVPTQARLTNSTSLTRYAMVAYRTRFVDYFNDVLLPHLQKEEPGLTRQALLERLSLRRLEPYLRGADTVWLVHNADDIILGPGELQYLEGVFGTRARVFPTGGHLGNVFHPEVARTIVGFLTGKDN